eukprot:UN4348
MLCVNFEIGDAIYAFLEPWQATRLQASQHSMGYVNLEMFFVAAHGGLSDEGESIESNGSHSF